MFRTFGIYKSHLTFLLAYCLCISLITATGQVRRQLPTKQPAVPQKKNLPGKFDPYAVENMETLDSGNKFAEKGLPEPADFGGAPSDKLAAAMAREISNYDEDRLPLLITMLQRAGFFIIDNERKTIYQPTTGNGMGLAFFDFEVAGMYKLSRRGFVTSIEKIAGQITKESPEISSSVVADLIVRDIRTSANSTNKIVRFWARLIIELGKASPNPVDLTVGDVKSAPLNIIQASLLERRLIGDIAALAMKMSASSPFLKHGDNIFIKASYPNYRVLPDCQLNDVEGLIMDAASLGLTTGNGWLINFIQETIYKGGNQVLGKVASGLGTLNTVLSWVKLVAALMTLKGSLTIEDPMPLVRTKNAVEGQSRMMTARVWADVGNLSYLNCVRLALNASTGLDFSMPNDGPLADRDISWELKDKSSFGGQKSSQTGEFDNFVNLKAPNDVAQRDPTKQITNANGESRMQLVGAPKIPAVINKPVVPVRKSATVSVAVAFKSARDKMQNFIDIGGAALGVATGGVVSILGVLPEIGYRTKWEASRLTAPVTDWELCTDDWAGAVEYTRRFSKTEVINSPSRKGTRRINEFLRATWEVIPRTRTMPADTAPIPANLTVTIKNSDIFEGIGEADVCCNDKATIESGVRIREAITHEVNTRTKELLDIKLSRNLLLSIYPKVSNFEAFRGPKRKSLTVSESVCPVDPDANSETVTDEIALPILVSLANSKTERQLTREENGVEIIFGSDTFDSPGGGEITYTWWLARCGD